MNVCVYHQSGMSSPAWWVLVDVKRVRLLGVRAQIHRSLSLLPTASSWQRGTHWLQKLVLQLLTQLLVVLGVGSEASRRELTCCWSWACSWPAGLPGSPAAWGWRHWPAAVPGPPGPPSSAWPADRSPAPGTCPHYHGKHTIHTPYTHIRQPHPHTSNQY